MGTMDWISKCVLISVISPKLEYAEDARNAKMGKKLETAQMTIVQKSLGCSKTTSKCSIESRIGNVVLTQIYMGKLK